MESDVTVDSEWSKVQLRLARNPAFTALATQEERQAIFDDYQAELRVRLSVLPLMLISWRFMAVPQHCGALLCTHRRAWRPSSDEAVCSSV